MNACVYVRACVREREGGGGGGGCIGYCSDGLCF